MKRIGYLLLVVALVACGGSSGSSAPCSQSLFLNWKETSFTPSIQGAVPVTPFLLAGKHYGAGQSFSFFFATGSCNYTADIEQRTSGTPETGTVTLSNPTPNAVPCTTNAGTATYDLNCETLTITSAGGVSVYAPQ